MRKTFITVPWLLLLFVWSIAFTAYAAPASKLEDRHWLSHDPNSDKKVDHVVWDGFLSVYVNSGRDGINYVDYQGVTDKDKQALKEYLIMLENTKVTAFNRHEQMAYWINFYNALTVNIVLDAYPVDSIIDISGGFFDFGPWDKTLVKVEGRELSLNNIEHNILRPIWKDPRIHYAVNCASVGCPNLALRAYNRDRLEPMLESASSDYVNHQRGVSISGEQELTVSSIYVWYKVDFGGSNQGVIEHIKKYANKPLLEQLKKNEFVITNDAYDWSLNEVRQ